MIGLWISVHLAFASPDPGWVAMRDSLVRDAKDSELVAWETGKDWKKRVLAMDVRAWQYDRALAMLAWSSAPASVRGALAFADPRLQTEEAAGPMLARLVWGAEPQEVRVALAEAISHAGRAWGSVVMAMLPAESDPSVRAAFVQDARFADGVTGAGIVRLGFEDNASTVRVAAARTATWISPANVVGDAVLRAMEDPDATVRAEAARTAGWLNVDGAWQPLVGLLADEDPRVRLQALKALQRLDAPAAATLPELDALRRDQDVKVQRAATSGGE